MKEIIESNLYEKITSDAFIYKAIYSVENSINEKNLLKDEDLLTLKKLRDPFNEGIINEVIKDVKSQIDNVLINDEFFTSSVYFRPKKKENGKIVNRPLHTSDLITIITSIVFLNAIILDTKECKFELSEIAKILPENFYGNIPSLEPNQLFKPWSHQYREYISNATKKYNEYRETQEYKYEVTLDLVDFFPSINPIIIYNEIIRHVAFEYPKDEICYKKILIKLLTFKVKNLTKEEIRDFYYLETFKNDFNLVKGIPQGLPHSYFFGNVCMIKISEIFLKHLQGVSFFYVDDSIIYTNSLKNIQDLKSKIELINLDLSEYCIANKVVNSQNNLNEFFDFEESFQNYYANSQFIIKVHNEDSVKSFALVIQESGLQPSILIEYSKLASITSNDINKLFSDLEESNLSNRLEALYENIESEIKIEKAKNEDSKSNYLKLLIRYKKFFKYRQVYLKQTESEDTKKDDFNKFIEKINLKSNDMDSFFTYYNEDILPYEIELYFNWFIQSRDLIKSNLISLSEEMYFKNYEDRTNYIDYNIKNSYFYKYIESLEYQRKTLDFLDFDKYDSLKIDIRKFVALSKKTSIEVKNSKISELIKFIQEYYKSNYDIEVKSNNDLHIIIQSLKIDNIKNSRFKYISFRTHEILRMIINVYLSDVIQVEISDKIIFNKRNIKPIQNKEARLLFFVRNKCFSFEDFLSRFSEYSSENNDDIFDYSILNVIEYFEKHIKKPLLIDDLILVHKYTSDIWKNGSKFLHFYTLHNHEHAIEIIKSIILFKRSISYFQISYLDYYILFISCYLHDISMVLHPNLISEFTKDKKNSDLILSEFKNNISEILGIDSNLNYENNLSNVEVKVVKRILVDYFVKLDQFYEHIVRDKHVKESADFILKSNDLAFIDATIRDIVAEVGRGHGYLTEEIYNTKSKSSDHIINEKYMKILLRLGDLMDVSSSRITNVIFNNNQKNMSRTTRFHWLSHRAISNIDIRVEYRRKDIASDVIHPKKIQEDIYFEIYLKNSHMINIKKDVNCHHRLKLNYPKNKDELTSFLFKIGSDEINNCDKCNFMCKWMLSKNEYLHLELLALKKYVDNLKENIFESNFYITYKIEKNAQKLSNSDYTSIINFINFINN